MLVRLPPSLASLLLASFASAQHTLDALSFGHSGVISPSGHGIQGWHTSNVNHEVQLLSDRVILTPPVPGNAKGALWTQATASSADWTAELQFRASGQEMGNGNLQVWYTKEADSIGVNSAYNVEKFDGFVLVIDQYGGSGGKIRGFLNDGSQNFRTHSSLESLAFGHCDYSYRNLGRPSKVTISNRNGLTVSIDDRTCFSSDKISLPSGYYFGITASTGENPDSFEIHKFLVTAGGQPVANQNQGQIPMGGQQNQVPQLQKLDSFPGAPEAVPDRSADEIKSQSDQFADLHNRVQALQHLQANMFLEFKTIANKIDTRHSEMLVNVQNIKGSQETGLPPETIGQISQLARRVEEMEKVIQIIKREVEGKDYRQHLNDLHMAVERMQGGISEHLPERIGSLILDHRPRFGLLVIILVGVQLSLAGGYVIYKRRRNGMPKKYL